MVCGLCDAKPSFSAGAASCCASGRQFQGGTIVRNTHVLVAVAALVAVGVASVSTAVAGDSRTLLKPRAGQLCSAKKTPPKGFTCVKSKGR